MTQDFLPNIPFNSLLELPPQIELETKAVLKQCVQSRAALEGLKHAAALIPNPDMLINPMLLLEAQSSSEIENIITTTDKLFEHMGADSNADPATKEALRYREALYFGYYALKKQNRPVTSSMTIDICTKIKGFDMAIRHAPGTALYNQAHGGVVYTPPIGAEIIQRLLGNWEHFINEDSMPPNDLALDFALDPLIKMAVAHYQFEAIHPFTDGNGRTGRVVNSLLLIQYELLDAPILYLSRYIIEHKNDYYQLLLDVTTQQAWEAWLLFILKGVEQTAKWTTQKIRAIHDLSKNTQMYVKDRLPKIYSMELVNLIFNLPYCRISDLVNKGIAKRETASKYLKQLVEIGVLTELVSTSRDKVFIHPKLMRLLKSEGHDFERYHSS